MYGHNLLMNFFIILSLQV